MTDNTPVPRAAQPGRVRRPAVGCTRRPADRRGRSAGEGVDAQSVALVAVFTALLVAAAVVPGIPVGGFGVPITLQTLAVMLTGLVLGPLRGGLAVLLYLLLGFVGLPVFSRGQSGLQVLSGPTAGYLVSFVVAAARRRARGARRRPAHQPGPLGAPAARRVVRHDRRRRPRARRRSGSWSTSGCRSRPRSAPTCPSCPGDLVKDVVAVVAAVAVHRAFPDVLVRPGRRDPCVTEVRLDGATVTVPVDGSAGSGRAPSSAPSTSS